MSRIAIASNNFRTECFFNLTTEERILLFKKKQSLRLDVIYRNYFGWMMLPFASCALMLTIVFIVAVFNAIRMRRVSRKCYILLLNRALGDVFTCVVALVVCCYVLLWNDLNPDIVQLFESFLIGSFWSAMVSYVSLSALKLFAVARPFAYRNMVTMKRCIYLVVFSWIMFVVIIFSTLGVTALVKIPALNALSGCRMETCARWMYRTRSSFTIAVYFITVGVFIVTVVLIKRAERFVESFNHHHPNRATHGESQNRHETTGVAGRKSTSASATAPSSSGISRRADSVRSRFPLWKLTLNVSTFAGFYSFYVIIALWMLFFSDQCFYMRHYNEMTRVLAFIRCSMIMRILIDPILTFLTDAQIRRGMLAVLHLDGVARVGAKTSRVGTRDLNSSDFGTSTAPHQQHQPMRIQKDDNPNNRQQNGDESDTGARGRPARRVNTAPVVRRLPTEIAEAREDENHVSPNPV